MSQVSQVYKLSLDEQYTKKVNDAIHKVIPPKKQEEVTAVDSITKIKTLAVGETFSFVYELAPEITINEKYVKKDRFDRKVYNIWRERTVFLDMLDSSLKEHGNAFLNYDVIFKDEGEDIKTISRVFVRARKNDKGTINVSLFYSKY